MYSMYCIVYSKSCFYVRACIFIVIHENCTVYVHNVPMCMSSRSGTGQPWLTFTRTYTSVRRLVASFYIHIFVVTCLHLVRIWGPMFVYYFFFFDETEEFYFWLKSLANCFRSILLLRWTNVIVCKLCVWLIIVQFNGGVISLDDKKYRVCRSVKNRQTKNNARKCSHAPYMGARRVFPYTYLQAFAFATTTG